MSRTRRIILSCEHAGNRVPPEYRHLFKADPGVLKTHRAYDIGIAAVAKQLQKMLGCPLCLYEYTRLLVDANRTRKASQFSEFTQPLSDAQKQRLRDAYDAPYKAQLLQLIGKNIKTGPVFHLSLHSFTPELKAHIRTADIGILYDPSSRMETDYAKELQRRLRQITGLKIRRNYPYLGRADGMTTWLRKQFPQSKYLGIELEFNQAYLNSLTPKKRQSVVKLLAGIL